MTSNVVESQNNSFNKMATNGRKSVADFAVFMNQQKSKEYTEKLFKSQDKRWNMQRKATRDKWDRKRDFFDELTA